MQHSFIVMLSAILANDAIGTEQTQLLDVADVERIFELFPSSKKFIYQLGFKQRQAQAEHLGGFD